MSSKIRNVALLLPAFVLATGLASAQPSVKVTTVNSDGSVTSTNLTGTPNGPGAKAPTPAADGSAKYWDGLGIGGASTNYFTQVPYITAPPNPQIAAGPDDILTIVNRTISRYPNPNAAGNTGTLNPYNYPPTEFVPLDVWMGLTVLGGNQCYRSVPVGHRQQFDLRDRQRVDPLRPVARPVPGAVHGHRYARPPFQLGAGGIDVLAVPEVPGAGAGRLGLSDQQPAVHPAGDRPDRGRHPDGRCESLPTGCSTRFRSTCSTTRSNSPALWVWSMATALCDLLPSITPWRIPRWARPT